MIANWIFLGACVPLFVVPMLFVAHDVYEDGLIGRMGLLGISFPAGASLGEAVFGDGFDVHPLVAMMCLGAAVFLVWHLFRFHRRVLQKHLATVKPA